MDRIYTVLLDTGTVGTIEGQAVVVGEQVSVHLHDDGGCPIEAEGILVEVLDVESADGTSPGPEAWPI